jgi:[ribosomal protein S18]-alanine N-acetyltransferase
MSAVPQALPHRFEPLHLAQVTGLDELMQVEVRAYPFPWTRQNFEDGLKSGYRVQRLLAGEELLAYYVAMQGVDEVHLLNLTVAPEHQGQGWAQACLRHLTHWAQTDLRARQAWLEVRTSNVRAQRLYTRFGFQRIGHRKGYYPNGSLPREDAVVMGLQLAEVAWFAGGLNA